MFYLWYLQTGILQYFHGNIAICLFVSIKTKTQNIHIAAYRLVNIRKEAYACLWRFLWFGFLPLLKTYVAVKHAVFRKNFCNVNCFYMRKAVKIIPYWPASKKNSPNWGSIFDHFFGREVQLLTQACFFAKLMQI